MLSSFVQDGSFCSDNSDQCAPWAWMRDKYRVYDMLIGLLWFIDNLLMCIAALSHHTYPKLQYFVLFQYVFQCLLFSLFRRPLWRSQSWSIIAFLALLILPGKRLSNLTEAWYTWDEWKILLPAEQRASALAFVVDGGLWHHNVWYYIDDMHIFQRWNGMEWPWGGHA